MRKHLATLLIISALGALAVQVVVPRVAHAAVVDLLVKLNGSATKVGVITAAGSNTTNVTTATPFTVTAGKAYQVVCDAAVNYGVQGTCHATITNANYCLPLASGVRDWFIASGSTVAIIGTASCALFEMN